MLVFYAGQFLEDFEPSDLMLFRKTCSSEIYNGAILCAKGLPDNPWYRLDGTPMLLTDVPKELQMLVLVLT